MLKLTKKKKKSINDCLREYGIAVNWEACVEMTAFCWANGLEVSSIAFELYQDSQLADHEVELELI